MSNKTPICEDDLKHKPIHVLLYGLYLCGLNIPSRNEREDCNNIKNWILSNFDFDNTIEAICQNSSFKMCEKIVYYLKNASTYTSLLHECEAIGCVINRFEAFSRESNEASEEVGR
jgi:hypothetical protein